MKSRFSRFLLAVLCFFALPVAAQNQAPEILSQSAVVIDAETRTIVYSKNPDDEIPPASLTKLMTMHLALREIEAGRASLEEIITPPRESWAANQLPRSSIMGLAGNQRVSLGELLLGMAVFSGNDAATAVAMRFAPTVGDFTEMMNREARDLGLNKTRFVDASGYSEENMTTARELAEFCCIYLKSHPESLNDYHSVRYFSYGARTQRNNNTLLGNVEGVDGLKTGYIPESGYNLALTALRNGSRFIVVILGAPSEWNGDRIRDDDGRKLLEWAFLNYRTVKPNIGLLPQVRVWKGMDNSAHPVPAQALVFTARAERGEEISFSVQYNEPVIAPLKAGSPVGNLLIYDSLGELRQIPLVISSSLEKGGFFKRLIDTIKLFFMQLLNS